MASAGQVDAHPAEEVAAVGSDLPSDGFADLLFEHNIPGGAPGHRHRERRAVARHAASWPVHEPGARDPEAGNLAVHIGPGVVATTEHLGGEFPKRRVTVEQPEALGIAQHRVEPGCLCVGVCTLPNRANRTLERSGVAVAVAVAGRRRRHGGTVAEPVHLRKCRHHKSPTPDEAPGPNEQLPSPGCAVLTGVMIAGGLTQDPNGDPNDPQQFRAFDPPTRSQHPWVLRSGLLEWSGTCEGGEWSPDRCLQWFRLWIIVCT